MKEPTRIKLTDSPENKKVKLIRLKPAKHIEEEDEDYSKNNTQSIQQLESKQTD